MFSCCFIVDIIIDIDNFKECDQMLAGKTGRLINMSRAMSSVFFGQFKKLGTKEHQE